MALFESLVERIEAAYSDLNHNLGWRFLYTPKRTLAPETRLLFVGLNPAVGEGPEEPKASVEEGNAYREEIEKWPTQLQRRVRKLFEALAARLDVDAIELMDGTLTSNFCPFRSADWPSLHKKQQSIAFSNALWRDILEFVERPVLLCNGKSAGEYLRRLLERQGARPLGAPERDLISWGNTSIGYELVRYDDAMVVALPHLSRFKLVRPESQRAVDRIVSAVAAAITER
jgi:hypothetical protein